MAAAASLAVVVALAGCDGDDGGPGPPDALGLEPGQERTLEGVVVENTIDPCALPDHDDPCDEGGPERLRLDVDGAGVSVTYHYGEHEPCDNVPVIAQGSDARAGTRVEVHGLVEAAGAIDVCPSPDYYIEPVG